MSCKDLQAAREAFSSLVRSATTKFHERCDAQAVSMIQDAANIACLRHPGFLCSPETEVLLTEIAARSGSKVAMVPASLDGEIRRVLHVLTQAYEIGGHTRLVWRWIENDPGRRHSIVLTQQKLLSIPDKLRTAAIRSGGQLQTLDSRLNLIDKAFELQKLGCSFDAVVLHVHPFDVIPILAWASTVDRPPIIHVNHADHLFWLGASLCDVNVNIRLSGYRASIERRGIKADRNIILPIPLSDEETKRLPRAEAKFQLGLSAESQVALTIASSYKFNPVGQMDYVNLHRSLLDQFPNLQILVVGPSEKADYWRAASMISGGRFRAVEAKSDIDVYLAAADVYLDSTPFGSLTSLLEAGLAGVPCCSWRPHPAGSPASVLACDDISLEGLPVVFNDLHKYLDQVREYLTVPLAASVSGSELRDAILKTHTGEAWQCAVAAVYDRGKSQVTLRPHSVCLPPNCKPGIADRMLLALQGGYINNPIDPTERKRGLFHRLRRSLRKRLFRSSPSVT